MKTSTTEGRVYRIFQTEKYYFAVPVGEEHSFMHIGKSKGDNPAKDLEELAKSVASDAAQEHSGFIDLYFAPPWDTRVCSNGGIVNSKKLDENWRDHFYRALSDAYQKALNEKRKTTL